MPEWMSPALTRLIEKPGRQPALVTALGLGALLVAQQLLTGIVLFLRNLGWWITPNPDGSAFDLTDAAVGAFYAVPDSLLFQALPIVISVFLALWLVVPISGAFSLRNVLTKAGVLSVCAAVLVIVFMGVHGIFQSMGVAGDSLAWGSGDPSNPAPPGINFAVFGQYLLDALSAGVGVL